RSLSLKDQTTPPDPTRRKVAFGAKSATAPAANRIVPPLPLSPGDPTTGGGRLEVYNSAGSAADHVVVTLPAGGWSPLGTARKPKGWQFRASAGPIAKVKVVKDAISVKGGGASWTYTLDEIQQGRVAVRLLLGADTGWCADAPAKTSGNPPSTLRNDHVDKFVGQKNAPPPAVCPGSPSGAFLD